MFGKKARIYTYSIIHVGSLKFSENVPYLVAVVEDEHGRFLTRVEGYTEGQNIQIGMEVVFLKNDQSGRPIYSLMKELE